MLKPLLSDYDLITSSEGALDPLGLYSIFTAHHLPLEKARQMIRKAAQTAVSRIGEIPLAELPDSLHLEIDFSLSQIAHLCSLIPGVERIDARTIGYKGKDYREIQHVRIVCTNLALACVRSHF
jgi:D-aminopeptidase